MKSTTHPLTPPYPPPLTSPSPPFPHSIPPPHSSLPFSPLVCAPFHPSPSPFCRSPQNRSPPLSLLCVVGAAFTVSGLSLVFTGPSLVEAVPFLVLGGLTLIPGVFHVGLLYLAYTHSYGWTFHNVPNYETH